ncbi:hypothetical protein PABG_11605 [Paracoccidioides brasiliensis Pb03]|nr:hypothetical protein PABG_11605 [Paracoccidioides brasiliensis Pb03]
MIRRPSESKKPPQMNGITAWKTRYAVTEKLIRSVGTDRSVAAVVMDLRTLEGSPGGGGQIQV